MTMMAQGRRYGGGDKRHRSVNMTKWAWHMVEVLSTLNGRSVAGEIEMAVRAYVETERQRLLTQGQVLPMHPEGEDE